MVQLILVGGVWKPSKLIKFGQKYVPRGLDSRRNLGFGLMAVGVSTRGAKPLGTGQPVHQLSTHDRRCRRCGRAPLDIWISNNHSHFGDKSELVEQQKLPSLYHENLILSLCDEKVNSLTII